MKFNMSRKNIAILMAILAAVLYGISSPISKVLLTKIPPTLMAGLLYVGAGTGMFIINILKKVGKRSKVEARITKKDYSFVIGMIILDILAPIFLMVGLTKTTSSNASLLNNFEIVATAVIASFVFKEAIGRRMWVAISLITTASIILSVEDMSSFNFSMGSIFIIGACLCWGFENNCTRMLSLKDPFQIVVIKGFGSGLGSLLISFLLREYTYDYFYIMLTLILGFVAYGLSIYFYILAQRELGAARTSSFYATAPFIGVLISWVFLHEGITLSFLIALAIMFMGAYFAVFENHKHMHIHDEMNHDHRHSHNDGHHDHIHSPEFVGEHSHQHTHIEQEHKHSHTPDLHHRHVH